MIKDQLTRDERVRLECFAQAQGPMGRPGESLELIITRARQIEEYVRGEASP